MTRARLRRQSPSLTRQLPTSRESSPRPSVSSFSRDGASSTMSTSRPTSLAILAAANRPSLQDILANRASPPWTLGAFMAYLSQNHCLETLEFTMEAERYQAAHVQAEEQGGGWEHVIALWQKLMNAYITPCGPREVNLPAPVRDRLLALACSLSPPRPSELDEAVKIVYELMNDSVLLPFLDSTSPIHPEPMVVEEDEDDSQRNQERADSRQGRTRQRPPKDSAHPGHDEGSRSPRTSFLPQLNMGRRSDGQSRSASASVEPVDREAMTDDSGGSTTPGGEPLTPPTTPPTSDWAFSTSPGGGLHRAISAHNNGWKRMSARLGLSRKSRSGRKSNSSNVAPSSASTPDGDVHMADIAPSNSNPL
jgi:hypothetical protein